MPPRSQDPGVDVEPEIGVGPAGQPDGKSGDAPPARPSPSTVPPDHGQQARGRQAGPALGPVAPSAPRVRSSSPAAVLQTRGRLADARGPANPATSAKGAAPSRCCAWWGWPAGTTLGGEARVDLDAVGDHGAGDVGQGVALGQDDHGALAEGSDLLRGVRVAERRGEEGQGDVRPAGSMSPGSRTMPTTSRSIDGPSGSEPAPVSASLASCEKLTSGRVSPTPNPKRYAVRSLERDLEGGVAIGCRPSTTGACIRSKGSSPPSDTTSGKNVGVARGERRHELEVHRVVHGVELLQIRAACRELAGLRRRRQRHRDCGSPRGTGRTPWPSGGHRPARPPRCPRQAPRGTEHHEAPATPSQLDADQVADGGAGHGAHPITGSSRRRRRAHGPRPRRGRWRRPRQQGDDQGTGRWPGRGA